MPEYLYKQTNNKIKQSQGSVGGWASSRHMVQCMRCLKIHSLLGPRLLTGVAAEETQWVRDIRLDIIWLRS